VALASVAGVRVASVARPSGAESRVALVVDEEGGPSADSVAVSEGKRRRVDDSSEEEGAEVRTSVVVPTGLRGGALEGPRLMAERVGGVRRGSGIPADLFVRRASRFVDRSMIGIRNGMVGDTYYSRGESACARGRGSYNGGYAGRGYRPYR